MWYNIYISFSSSVQEDLPQQLPDSGPPSPGESSPEVTEKHWDKQEELQRQKTLLEESRKRTGGNEETGLEQAGFEGELGGDAEETLKTGGSAGQAGRVEEETPRAQRRKEGMGQKERTRQSLEEG